MINICDLLYEICENDNVYNKDFDLLENDLLDSFAIIQLFTAFEDNGIELYPTKVSRENLRTARKIEKLIEDYYKK